MKTKLLFSSFVIAALSVNAQITITTADMPLAGQSYISANDTNVTSVGSAGANQTWNFAAWANHTTDTVQFVGASSLPGFSFFPTATIGNNNGGSSVFMKNSTSSFDILGFYADFGYGPMALPFSPVQKFISFPSTYLTAYTGVSKYVIKIAGGQPGLDSLKIKSSNTYSSNIDAWGSVTTPANSNVSTLRQKYVEISRDSTFLKPTGQGWILAPSSGGNPNPRVDTTNSYRWWSNTKKFPIAEITAKGNNVVTKGSYLLITTVGVKENSIAKNELSVFPNPATDKINITGISTESFVLIFDVNGKLMETTRLKKSNTSINTSEYQSGIYFYKVVALNGNAIGNGKFVVSK